MLSKIDLSKYIVKKYKKNDIIKNQNDICNSVGIILSGSISIYNDTISGDTFIISTLIKNELFGENLIFSEINKYPGNIIANTNCIICFIKKTEFIALLKTTDFLIIYLTYTSNKYIKLNERLKILSQPTIEKKILYFMSIELEKTNNDYILIKSVTSLAIYLNITRPSLSRSINNLIKLNQITKKGKRYYLNKK